MRKTLQLLVICLSLFHRSAAQTDTTDIDKKELHDLLDERKQKFDSYFISIEKHSGIFGNKTKNDIKNSGKVLVDIVKIDNRIISAMYRVVDFRSYQKVNMNYDIQKKDEALNNLRHATDTLSKQVEVLKSTNRSLRVKAIGFQWLFYALCCIAIWLLIKRKRTLPAKNSPSK